MTIYVMIRDVPLGTKHRNWKDGNNEDLCRFHRRHVARLGRRGARDDRRRPGVGPARIRAERRTHGRMAFARRFRSSPPAGEHRVVFLHVARRIASEPGRRTRFRRHARTGRTGRPRLPARPAAAARIQATACTRRKTHPPERRRISALQGFRSEPSRISAGRPSEVRGRRSRASGRKRPNRTSAGRKNADPGQAGVRIEGASCRLGKHADLIPEHVRARMRQLHRREPVQTVGMPPVDSRRQRRARHRMPLRKHASARLPRLEGLPRRSRLTQKKGPHPRSKPTN